MAITNWALGLYQVSHNIMGGGRHGVWQGKGKVCVWGKWGKWQGAKQGWEGVGRHVLCGGGVGQQ